MQNHETRNSNVDPIAELVQLLARLPGIGERTATRLAFHILAAPAGYAEALGKSVATVHSRVRPCLHCGNYTTFDPATDAVCRICADPRRDGSLLCVVGNVPDLVAIERSGSFRGRYFVLHGLVDPLNGIGPEKLPMGRLVEHIRASKVREVIVATPLSVEGEATALYVAETLRSHHLHISRIASGVPHGGELEFTDQVTMARAFEGRRTVSDPPPPTPPLPAF